MNKKTPPPSSREPAISLWFSKLGRGLQLVLALGLMLGVWFVDYQTGPELAFSIFYLAPIALVAWYVGRREGIAFSLAAAFLWWLAEFLDQHIYTYPSIAYWNALVRLGFFLIVNQLVSLVWRELALVRELSQRDHLTNAVNRRYFTELAEVELARTARSGRAVSLAYIDLDNFKKVNDTMGHEMGDQILTTVVNLLSKNLRRPDVVARIGGDEFLILMPETDSGQARTVISRLLEQCDEVIKSKGWPIGLSIGVTSCDKSCTLEDLVKSADEQMYEAKQRGKSQACYREIQL